MANQNMINIESKIKAIADLEHAIHMLIVNDSKRIGSGHGFVMAMKDHTDILKLLKTELKYLELRAEFDQLYTQKEKFNQQKIQIDQQEIQLINQSETINLLKTQLTEKDRIIMARTNLNKRLIDTLILYKHKQPESPIYDYIEIKSRKQKLHAEFKRLSKLMKLC